MKCETCDGCGKVANDATRTPWKYWESLPIKNGLAVLVGLVKPKTCPTCNGKGSVEGGGGDSKE